MYQVSIDNMETPALPGPVRHLRMLTCHILTGITGKWANALNLIGSDLEKKTPLLLVGDGEVVPVLASQKLARETSVLGLKLGLVGVLAQHHTQLRAFPVQTDQ